MRVTTDNGKLLTLSKQIGEGGEARIFSTPGGLVAKVYKGPDDPSFATGGSEEQRNRDGAGRKLREIWDKLAAFPTGMPASVVSPLELISAGGQNVGYLMRAVASPHARMRDWMDRTAFKSLAIDTVREAFIRLASTLPQLHGRGVVVGDFNDLNVLIPSEGPVLIDADSFQYGKFPCRTFQTRFVDPRICVQAGSSFTMVKPHTTDTDWYALLIMLYQVLRGVGPYDGIHKPKGAKPVAHGLRPLQRITVHRPDVIVPKFATPADQLHPDLMHAFTQRIDKDERGPIPESLLYLIGEKAGFVAPASVTKAKGKVVAEEIFLTPARTGTILQVALTAAGPTVISAIRSSLYRDGNLIMTWPGNPSLLQFRCADSHTVVMHGSSASLIKGRQFVVDVFDHKPVLATCPTGLIYQFGSDVIRESVAGDIHETLGTVSGTANFWYGSKFGLGFYRAGMLYRYFTFKTDGTPFDDRVAIQRPLGQVVDEGCHFGAQAWYWRIEQRRRVHYLLWCIDKDGKTLCSLEAKEGDDSWLENIRGAAGAGNHLYVPTDNGMLRVGLHLDATEFPDTAPWIDGATKILGAHGGGIVVWNGNQIFRLKMT